MSLSLDRMRFLLTKGLKKENDTTFTYEDADELLNISFWDIADRFDFYVEETLLASALVEDQREYSISDADLGLILKTVKSVAIIDSNNRRRKLARTTRDWLDVNQDDEITGYPTRYVREGSILILDPIPGADEDDLALEISIQESLASLVDGSKETTGLPRNWDELVLKGAIHRGHFIFSGDYDSSAKAENLTERKINQLQTDIAKGDRDSRYSGLQVLWDFPENADDEV